MYFVYMLRCSDNSIYTGITPDLSHRMRQHLGLIKGGARYTALRPPTEIAALWTAADRSAASKAEYAIKHLTAEQKRSLIADPDLLRELAPRLEEVALTAMSCPKLEELTASDRK